jgi:hypothetical protein
MEKLPQIKFTIPNLVIGWRLPAVLYAVEHKYPLIVNCDQRPHRYTFGYEDEKCEWITNIFNLGLASLLPVPFDIQTLGFEEENLKVITNSNSKILISFEKLHIFDTENCSQLNVGEEIMDYEVYDYFAVRKGAKQPEMTLKIESSFLKTAKFIPTNRIDWNQEKEIKDILAYSVISIATLITLITPKPWLNFF